MFARFIESVDGLPLKYFEFKNSKKLKKPHKYYMYGYAAMLIRSVIEQYGFTQTQSLQSASVIIGGALPKGKCSRMKASQKTNHYAFTFSLGSKEGYHRVISQLARRLGEKPSFYPETYLLPEERTELVKAFPSSALWIKKPAASARGIGIKVIRKVPQQKAGKKAVVQKYVMNPLLINGLKFDLRFYVVVASVDPLRIYVYDNGLVRLATSKYEENLGNIANRAAHLTNYSVNKNKKEFVRTDDMEDDGQGNKWSHAPFWPYLESIGFDVEEIRRKIDDAFVTVIMSATRIFRAQKNNRQSFELFGFDVMIDKDQNVYVLEVNVCPAMGTSTELDRHVKEPMIREMFDLALMPKPTKANDAVTQLMTTDNTEENAALRQFIAICEYEMVQMRLESFRCIYPTAQRCTQMVAERIFDCPSTNDEALAEWVGSKMSMDERKALLENGYSMLERYLGAVTPARKSRKRVASRKSTK